jgi:acetate kinase
MAGAILTLNSGSSSLKYALYSPALSPVESGEGEELAQIAAKLGNTKLTAIAHRIVHGGPAFTDHCLITPDVIAGLRKIEALAPNHLPPEIDLIEAAQKQFPGVPQFACFDTVFHRDMPDVAKLLPLPRRLCVRRYGFHGLSYTYLMGKLPEFIGDKAQGRVILAHLGSGASMAAVKNGKPIDTTMGMTPLGGLVMATRSGDLDPGIQSYLEKTQGISSQGYEYIVYAESGLLGISETSKDIRDLLKAEQSDPRARAKLSRRFVMRRANGSARWRPCWRASTCWYSPAGSGNILP